MGQSAFVSQQGSGSGARLTVNQNNSFGSGDVVRFDTSLNNYVLAQADTANNAEAVGVIESATSATFNVVFSGLIDLSEGQPDTGSFEAGKVYFLSAANANKGKLSLTPPATTGTVRKAMVTMMSSTKGVVQNFIGLQNGVSNDSLVDISEVQPVGTIAPFAGTDEMIPSGFLLCDGSSFSSVDYPDLAAIIGDTYLPHEGDTYYLPDFRGRVALGQNQQTNNQERADDRATRPLGDNGGRDSVPINLENMPQHSHIGTYKVYADDSLANQSDADAAYAQGRGPFDHRPPANTTNFGYPVDYFRADYPVTNNNWDVGAAGQDFDHAVEDRSVSIQPAGGSQPLNTINPYETVNFIIKASAQASAALFQTNLSALGDVDSTRGGTEASDTDSMKPGDMLSFDGSSDQFFLQPNISAEMNLMDNPCCLISQRGTNFNDTIASSFHTIDRWTYTRNGSSCFTISQETTGRPAPGIITSAANQVSNYYSPPMTSWIKIKKNNHTETQPGSYYAFTHVVEGQDWMRLWGSDFFTFSFLIQNDDATTSITETTPITVVFRNHAYNRSYVAPVTSSSQTNGWARVKITVPMAALQFADWQFNEGAGLKISFILGSGSDHATTQENLNVWKNDNNYAHPTRTNLNETNGMAIGGYIGLTQFQLEPGAKATNLKFPTRQEDLTKCQRYYQKSYDVDTIPGSSDFNNNAPIGNSDPAISNTCHDGVQFKTTMRTKPSVRLYNPRTANDSSRDSGNVGTFYVVHANGSDHQSTGVAASNIANRGTNGFSSIVSTKDLGNNSSGDNFIEYHYTADAEFLSGYSV